MRFYPLIILSHIFHFFRAKNCTQNNIFPLCFSLQSHFTTSNPLGKLKYCTQKSIYDKRTARPLKLRSGCFMQKTTPLHFCTGVVQFMGRLRYRRCFRPLQFCTGVVLIGIVCIAWESFRPLQFCTDVVRCDPYTSEDLGFRPLHFCTGVVRKATTKLSGICFRPLQFCTGVVRIPNLPQKAEVLDPCNFARV